MLDFSWKVFSMTGSVDTYLLIKELEKEHGDVSAQDIEEEFTNLDAH
ncbi:YqzL family protein [Alkalihalobacterium sp. APHAB7]|nr:YqzL family protein [Bacillaceae bacterium]